MAPFLEKEESGWTLAARGTGLSIHQLAREGNRLVGYMDTETG